MKLLLYQWGANNEAQLEESLRRLGHEVIPFAHECRHYTKDLELSMALIGKLTGAHAEGLVSWNYFPILSLVAQTVKIPYYSWVYDCPHFTLYSAPVMQSGNRIGIFDREMAEALKAKGVGTVFHLPLGVSSFQTRRAKEYACDLSFVGSLYTGEYDYYSLLKQEDIPKAEEAVSRQVFCYDADPLGEYLQDPGEELPRFQRLLQEQQLYPGDEYFMTDEEIIRAAILEKEVTIRERRKLLSAFAHRFGKERDFRIHTASKNPPGELLPYVKPPVDYHRQMPLVFCNSKVNLNITLRSIHTGIPLRVLDILSCGGFVLSNEQEELREYFREGEELALFSSLEEALEKAAFYLAHDTERERIAAKGQQALRERFDFGTQLRELLSC